MKIAGRLFSVSSCGISGDCLACISHPKRGIIPRTYTTIHFTSDKRKLALDNIGRNVVVEFEHQNVNGRLERVVTKLERMT